MLFDQVSIEKLYARLNLLFIELRTLTQNCIDEKISAAQFHDSIRRSIQEVITTFSNCGLLEAIIIRAFLNVFQKNIQRIQIKHRSHFLNGQPISKDCLALFHALQKSHDIVEQLYQQTDQFLCQQFDSALSTLKNVIQKSPLSTWLDVFQEDSEALEALEDALIMHSAKNFTAFDTVIDLLLELAPTRTQDVEKLRVLIEKMLAMIAVFNSLQAKQLVQVEPQIVFLQRKLETKKSLLSTHHSVQVTDCNESKEIADYLAEASQNPITRKRLSHVVIDAFKQKSFMSLTQDLTATLTGLIQTVEAQEALLARWVSKYEKSHHHCYHIHAEIFISNLKNKKVPYFARTDLENAYQNLQETKNELKKQVATLLVFRAYIADLRTGVIPIHADVLALYQEAKSVKVQFMGNLNKNNRFSFDETLIKGDGNCAVSALNDSCTQDISRNDIANYLNVMLYDDSIREGLKIYILEAWQSGFFEAGKEKWAALESQRIEQQTLCDALYSGLKASHPDYQAHGEEPIQHFIEHIGGSPEENVLAAAYQVLLAIEKKINEHAVCTETCENYVLAMREPGFWLDMQSLSLYAASQNIKLHIWQKSDNANLSIRHVNKPKRTVQVVHLLFINGNHFNRLTVHNNLSSPASSSSSLVSISDNSSSHFERPARAVKRRVSLENTHPSPSKSPKM